MKSECSCDPQYCAPTEIEEKPSSIWKPLSDLPGELRNGSRCFLKTRGAKEQILEATYYDRRYSSHYHLKGREFYFEGCNIDTGYAVEDEDCYKYCPWDEYITNIEERLEKLEGKC